MKQFWELILLAFKHKHNFLHYGYAVMDIKNKSIYSIWSECYKAHNELIRLCKKYPKEESNFDIVRIF